MALQILTTKIAVPAAGPGVVVRSRLLDHLRDAEHYPLTVVTAPAGFGKTTLVAAWARQNQAAWVSLETSDNDVLRFWSYVITALQTLEPGIGKESFDLVHEPPEEMLTPLINDLAALRTPCALVLDDLHLIHDSAVLEGLAFLVDHLPPAFHLVLASRIDPALPLSRLRARGQLLELRAADLRFNEDETSAFFSAMRLDLSEGQVGALERYTEGWAAALQLAALSIRRSADASSLIEAFTSGQQTLLTLVDYLAGEVLRQQPPDVQDFLVRVSVLRQLSPALCNAVTGRDDSREMLAYLVRSNLFLVELDETHHVYRYHHLFADFLRSQLSPEIEREACLRASLWYGRHELWTDAIDFALLAQEYERALALMEQYGHQIMHVGISVALDWFRRLPANLIWSRPSVCLHYAWALAISGQYDRIETYLTRAAEPQTSEVLGEIAALRTYVASRQGDLARTVEMSNEVFQHLPDANMRLRSLAHMSLAISYLWSGERSRARTFLSEIRFQITGPGDMHFETALLGHWGHVCLMDGQLRDALDYFQRALKSVDEFETLSSLAYLGMGVLSYEWNDLDAADRMMREGIERIGPIEGEGVRTYAYLALARLEFSRAHWLEAASYMQEAKEAASRSEFSWLLSQVAALQIRLWLSQGNLAAAIRWADANADQVLIPAREGEALALTRIWIARKQWDQAAVLLERLLDLAPQIDSLRSLIEILALQAVVFQAQGFKTQALTSLSRALELAEPEGYIRLFADENLVALLAAEQRRSPGSAYIHTLLRASGAAVDSDLSNDLLSERELEVLRLIAVGTSNEEIAAQLVISAATARKHVSNIFSKLDVHSRVEAVAAARKLNLLD
jgi:LuxR family maltose regulon positive regulatory protein